MVLLDISRILPGKLPQIVATLTACLTALSDGMQYGWSSPTVPVLLSPSTPVKIQESDVVWLENIYMIGGFFGLPLIIYLLDKLGRKSTLLLAILVNLLAWILIACAKSLTVLLIGRFLAGLGADADFITTPIYISEISDKQIRGRLGSLVYIMMMVGVLLVYSVAPFVSIVTTCAIGQCILLVQLIVFSFMPDSPYFLLVKKKKEEDRRSLQVLRGLKDVEHELNELHEVIEKENNMRGRPLDLFTVRSNRKAFLMLFGLCLAQNFGGISALLMNIQTILEDAATILNATTAAIIFSVMMLVASILSGTVMDKFGRRGLVCWSSFLTAAPLLILATYFTLKNGGSDVSSYNWVPVVVVMIYAFSFKFGLGLVPIVLAGELFPTNIKAFACTLVDCMYDLGGVLSIQLYHLLLDNFGIETPLFLFSFCCILTGIFTLIYVPETKGKSLEEIQQLLKGETVVPYENMQMQANSTTSNYGTNPINGNVHTKASTQDMKAQVNDQN